MLVSFSPSFVRAYNYLPADLQDEIVEKVESFKDVGNHRSLKVHKLSGSIKDRLSFSVNYKIRIVFRYLSTKPQEAYLLAVGDHNVYD